MFNTEICKLLNIEYPIIQGGMAWVATAELAAAVSNAGGLGIIGCGNAPAEVIKEEIDKVKKLTDKPFGANVMLLSPYVDEIMDLLYEEKVPVITTGAGNPGKYIDRFKSIGTKVIPVVPSVALAKRMEKVGADAIIAEGTEAGGHIGELTTMALIPQIVDAVNIPVIAAGGIADGRGVVAALALGAKGVQIGTRFVCTEECIAHDNYKEKIIKAKDRDAIATGRSTGHPVRIIKNKLAKKFIKLEKEGANKEEIEKLGVGALRNAVINGDADNGSVMAGQISGLIKEIKTCEDVIKDIISEAKEVIGSLKTL
ncbi:enoyl-[acyl-carrier-protein] reductase FabK [Thermohalobacter berrensis]|uniref:Probable nitronate monooxygenase n=1 Tax=Thermohalobacter berrensis TaxID=99594 RepID=A0A419TAA3_9FIRM|nr:enoyl-[acyl-carrier-protein] reductase FabK [Thermohalobacter berrensis]RKD34398.1 2-nitropropane dioxygenase [Thermohalobacter berrensis]